MTIMDFELAHDEDYREIAYIQILSYAAFRAKTVGYEKAGCDYLKTFGFTVSELMCYLSKNIKGKQQSKIRRDWLISCLFSICNIYIDGIKISKTDNLRQEFISLKDANSNNWRFVIKADEYMRFIEINSLYKSQKQISYAMNGIIVAIILGFVSIVATIVVSKC